MTLTAGAAMNDLELAYKDLSVLEDFTQVCELSNYVELPDDWYVVVTDIINSTVAIQSGQYKAVNMIGVSVISAILNLAGKTEIPYIFGGDGASLCIPARLLHDARQALIATRQLARDEFKLDLRVGIVAVSQIRQAGKRMLCARHRVSEYCTQAAFAGGGIEYAEYLLKSDSPHIDRLLAEDDTDGLANYAGLECRWDHVPSPHGETISLIVRSLATDEQDQSRFYRRVINEIQKIYGDDQSCRPVNTTGLAFTYANRLLALEAQVRTHGRGWYARLRHGLIMRIQNVLGWVFMRFQMNVAGVEWGKYKDDLVSNTDFRKFDGVLREVISGTAAQRLALDAWLQQQYENNLCVYGIHTSQSALITCLVSNRSGNHYHFVDGADGGYALAAAAMKQQLKAIRTRV